MAVYAVGDIQGCFKALEELLQKVNFNPAHDVLWCCGDIVNRGPDSLQVLRYLKNLGDACVCVLGNHDLQLLAYAAGGKTYLGDTLADVLAADDVEELITWLRFRPMLHHDAMLGWCMVHAGLSPAWTLAEAKKRARKIEKILRSDDWGHFCGQFQQKDYPRKEPKDKITRKFFSSLVFTRTRFCSAEGVFDWSQKTSVSKGGNVSPWFEHAQAKWKKDCRVVFGHWASKGLVCKHKHVFGLDTGCVWGGSLSMLSLAGKERRVYSVKCKACSSRA